MKEYFPRKGDLVLLYNDIKKPDKFFSFDQMVYVVIDVVNFKGKKILIKVKKREGSYTGWFDIEKVSVFYRDDFLNPILVGQQMYCNIQDPILIDFLNFHKIMKEMK